MKKGSQHSKAAKQKISENLKGNIRRCGTHHSEKTKQKMKEDRKGLLEKHPNWKGGKVKIICKVCKRERYVYPREFKYGKGKFCSNRCSAIWNMKYTKKHNTSIEVAIKNELIRRNIPYMEQTPILGIALVDFLLPNKIIIQCDGNYWHSKEKNKGKDIAQDTILFFKGYKVFRFTETEIKKSSSKCVDKIFR